MHASRKIYALIVAGGNGSRFDSSLPKQYLPLNGKTIIYNAIAPFVEHPDIAGVQVVIGPGTESLYQDALKDLDLLPPVIGGATRHASVFNGLKALASLGPDAVLVHDAARPFVTGNLIDRVIEGLNHADAVIPVIAVTDTVKKVVNGFVQKTIDREILKRVQTPQGFDFKTLYTLHQQFQNQPTFTDDAGLFEAEKLPVYCVQGDEKNIKITTPEDLPMIPNETPDIRVGHGYDVHAIGQGEGIMLFGCFVPCEFSLIGHSDADVGLHSITDALLGAIGDADIGHHFSPNLDQWKGADSAQFLKHAADKVRVRGGRINHIDATLIGEKPKVAPHRDIMRQRVADILDLPIDRVSIKATTTEKLGFCGRGEGLAVTATATVIL